MFHTDIHRPFNGQGQHTCPRLLFTVKEWGHNQFAGCHLPALAATGNTHSNAKVVIPGKYKGKQNKTCFHQAVLLFPKGHQRRIYFMLRTVWRAIPSPVLDSRILCEATLENQFFSVLSWILIAHFGGGSFFHSLFLPSPLVSGFLVSGREARPSPHLFFLVKVRHGRVVSKTIMIPSWVFV